MFDRIIASGIAAGGRPATSLRKLVLFAALSAFFLAASPSFAQSPMGEPQALEPEATPPQKPPPAPPRPVTGRQSGFSAHAALGAGVRWIFGDPLVAFDGTIGIGGWSHDVSVYGDAHLLIGRLQGLTVTSFTVGPTVSVAIVGPFHFGGGLELGGMKIERVTSGKSLDALLLGARVFAGYDVATFEDHKAIDVKLLFALDGALPFAADYSRGEGSSTTLFGTSLVVGARL